MLCSILQWPIETTKFPPNLGGRGVGEGTRIRPIGNIGESKDRMSYNVGKILK